MLYNISQMLAYIKNPKILLFFFSFLHLIIKWPGALSPDSQAQYEMAISGIYNDHHPALMSFVWRTLNYVLPGSGLMFLLQLSLLYGAVFYLINSIQLFYNNNKNNFGFIFVLFPFIPQIFRYSNVIWKDAHFAFSFLFVTAYLTYLTLNNTKPNYKQIIILLTILLYGTAVKYQAQFCAPILLGWLSWIMANNVLSSKKFITIFSTLLVFFYILINVINYILIPNVHKEHSWQYVKLYDLAAISRRVDLDLFPTFTKTQYFTMQELKHKLSYCTSITNCAYHKYAVDNLVFGKDAILQKSNLKAERKQLYCYWLKAIFNHPLIYLEHRITNMIGMVFSIPDVFKNICNKFNYNPILSWIINIFIYTTISNFLPVVLSIIYFIFGIIILHKNKHNLFAIPLVIFNAISILMIMVLFFCSMASPPRYMYVNVCMVHASHLFAYICFKPYISKKLSLFFKIKKAFV